MDLSVDAARINNLKTALAESGGTLAISWVGLAEFVSVRTPQTVVDANQLFSALRGYLAFLEVDPFVVAERAASKWRYPAHDAQSLQVVGPDLIAGREVLTEIAADNALRVCREELHRVFLQQISRIRNAIGVPRGDKQSLVRILGGRPLPLEAVVALIQIQLADKQAHMTNHDVFDLLHTAVPLCYCDVIVLDKRWRQYAVRAATAMAERELIPSVPTITSQQSGGLDAATSAVLKLAEGRR